MSSIWFMKQRLGPNSAIILEPCHDSDWMAWHSLMILACIFETLNLNYFNIIEIMNVKKIQLKRLLGQSSFKKQQISNYDFP